MCGTILLSQGSSQNKSNRLFFSLFQDDQGNHDESKILRNLLLTVPFGNGFPDSFEKSNEFDNVRFAIRS